MLKEKEVGKDGWFFDPDETDGDVVNQEYTVGAGRIDVLATFAHRTKLLVVETKAGMADFAALDQLKWYLKPEQLAELRRDKELGNVDANDVVGFLVAQGFYGIPPRQLPPNIHLFRCIMTGAVEEPTLKYVPPGRLPEAAACEDEAAPKPKRGSQLTRLSGHVDYIGSNNRLPQEVSQGLQAGFRRFLHCLLKEEDANRWVHPNPRGRAYLGALQRRAVDPLASGSEMVRCSVRCSPKRLRIAADTSEATLHECEEAILRDQRRLTKNSGNCSGTTENRVAAIR